MLIVLTTLLGTLSSMFRSRAVLELENLALRHQIDVLQRSARKRCKLTPADRLLWVWLSRLWRDWRSALAIDDPLAVRGVRELQAEDLRVLLRLLKSVTRMRIDRLGLDYCNRKIAPIPEEVIRALLWSSLHLRSRNDDATIGETLLFAYLLVGPPRSVEFRQDVQTTSVSFGEDWHLPPSEYWFRMNSKVVSAACYGRTTFLNCSLGEVLQVKPRIGLLIKSGSGIKHLANSFDFAFVFGRIPSEQTVSPNDDVVVPADEHNRGTFGKRRQEDDKDHSMKPSPLLCCLVMDHTEKAHSSWSCIIQLR